MLRLGRKSDRHQTLLLDCHAVAIAVRKSCTGCIAALLAQNDFSVAAVTPPASNEAAAARPAGLPEGVREGNENLVLLTAPAGTKLAALIAREKQGDFLRVAISGGGCNGLSYKMKFVPAPKRGDILVRTAGVRGGGRQQERALSQGHAARLFRARWWRAGSSSPTPMPRRVARAARASAFESRRFSLSQITLAPARVPARKSRPT